MNPTLPFHTMTRLLQAMLLTTAVYQSSHANDLPSPEQALRSTAKTFLTALRADSVQGLPTEEQLRRLSPHLTVSVKDALRNAGQLQDRDILRAPGEKPSWADGDLFSSLSEGVSQWKIAEVLVVSPHDGYVKVNQTFSEKGHADVAWQDTYIFRKVGPQWLLDDMVMEGEWSRGGSLRTNLPGGLPEELSHLSPDERWRFQFTMEGDAVAKMTLQAADQHGEPLVIEDRKGDSCLSFKTLAIWNAQSTAVAIRLGEGPRQSTTKVYRLKGEQWQEVKLPEPFPTERKTATGNGFREDTNLYDPLYWDEENTLVLQRVCTWSKGDEGDGISHRISIKVHHDREAEVLHSVDTP